MGKSNGKAATNSSVAIPPNVDEIIVELCNLKGDTSNANAVRREQTLLRWMLGQDLKGAALASGFSQSFADSKIYALKDDFSNINTNWGQAFEKVCGSLPDRYRSLCAARLPQIARIDAKTLDTYEANPELAIAKPAMLKQIKQSAGVLAVEVNAQSQPGVFITAAQVIMGQVYQQQPVIEAPKPASKTRQ